MLSEPCAAPEVADVFFIFDATGSMGDELRYLQAEMQDVIRRSQSAVEGLQIRTGALVYRDHTDDYVTRISRLTDDISVTQKFISEQHAMGGGDYEEAIPEALMASFNAAGWSEEARARIAFLVLDAPCHQDSTTLRLLHEQVLNAAAQGIRLVPVVCSGLRESGELLMRSLALFTNGTLPLLTALQALRITGEVITTPYSFVATTHSIWWNGCKPVFVDIDPKTGNLDPNKIEAAITPKTTAIMPVHCYGKPCDVRAIKEIADKYGLKVIYDAAHAFALEIPKNEADYKIAFDEATNALAPSQATKRVEVETESILNWGDISTLSFHATKVYNTIEGGAMVMHDAETKKRIDYLKNFGFAGETTVVGPGINSKVDEMRSAYKEGFKDGAKMMIEVQI